LKTKTGHDGTVIAIMYDFDKTLCTKDMQEYTFIPSLDESAEEFWKETGEIARNEKMDPILTYMYLMIRKSRDRHRMIRRDVFVSAGKNIQLFPGVDGWFDRINEYGKQHGAVIEHYIISSGLKEIIEGCPVSRAFREIYACEFHYDENGVADWPKTAVNYTNKTQFLFRINKGILDISNDRDLNAYVPEDERRIPFRNMIYIGDGMTDVPCMKLVKVNGGQSIAVYQKSDRTVVNTLLHDRRVDYIAKADYSEGSELDDKIKKIILKDAAVSELIAAHTAQMKSIQ
jgi:2-hydroxy-3-keto-5-methylthiopentenyl-1-phosphate phosphatase